MCTNSLSLDSSALTAGQNITRLCCGGVPSLIAVLSSEPNMTWRSRKKKKIHRKKNGQCGWVGVCG